MKEPAVLVQTPPVPAHVAVPAVHSFTSEQVVPFPVKPLLQLHEKAPAVLVHVASDEQPPLFVAHSFTSVQLVPSPA